VHIEGGDVMLWNDYIFIGTYKGSDYKDYITARTNMAGVQYIKELFPHKIVKEFDLVKSKLKPETMLCIWIVVFNPLEKTKESSTKVVFVKKLIMCIW
jgi:N-dimethylarginine dimethylaminohydrolase